MKLKNTYSLLFRLAYVGFAFNLMSCQEDDLVTTSPLTSSDPTNAEYLFTTKKGVIKEGVLYGTPITYEEIDGINLFQGDITLTPEQLNPVASDSSARTEGAGRLLTAWRWPNNIVFYSIDPTLPNQSRVTNAIAHWEANTNLIFVQRLASNPNYIYFKNNTDNICSSPVGMQRGRQIIELGAGCGTGATIHEIGHSVGLWHEQTRTDRDQFVTINWSNITPGKEHNFQTYQAQGEDGFNRGAFDLGSIMMYSSSSFSQNSRPTITRRDGSTYTAQRSRLSTGDIRIVRELYPGRSVILTNLAAAARWESGRLIDAHNVTSRTALRLNVNPSDRVSGKVEIAENWLEDRTKQPVLHMHPRWESQGTIKGWFPWSYLPFGARFEAEVGFIFGATGTDGVSFQVWEHHMQSGREVWNRVANVNKRYSGSLSRISIDLSHLAGQRVGIELRVDAGASSGQDWAAWVNPTIVARY